MGGAALHFVEGGLDVVEGPAAAGAGDVLALGDAAACGLHYIGFKLLYLRFIRLLISIDAADVEIVYFLIYQHGAEYA